MPNSKVSVSRSAASAAAFPAPIAAGGDTLTRVGFAPIVRVDAQRREVELCATSEAVDSYGTIFDYAASKEAFARWIGNVREMHERRAVGTRVGVRFDDAERRVYVRVRISRGAEDTWEKIQDGTLRGASIGASNVTWQRQTRPLADGERAVQVATAYDLVELSLVDNPANPDALGVNIVRDAVPDAALLDALDALDALEDTAITTHEAEGNGSRAESISTDLPATPMPRPPASFPGCPVKDAGHSPRASDAPSGEGRGAAVPAHEGIGLQSADVSALDATRSWTETRAELRGVATLSAPDAYSSASAPDAAAPSGDATPSGERATSGATLPLHAALLGLAGACACALCQTAAALYAMPAPDTDSATRANTLSSPSASSPSASASSATSAFQSPVLVRAVAAALGANVTRLDAVDATIRSMQGIVQAAVNQMSSTVGDLRLRLDALEAQPLPGGPVARPVEKALALAADASRGGATAAERIRALGSLAGRLSDPQAQIAVAAELIRLQQG